MTNSTIKRPFLIDNKYSSGESITISGSSEYTIDKDGLLIFYCTATAAWGYAELKINSKIICTAQNGQTAANTKYYGNIRVTKGDKIFWGNSNGGTTTATLFPYANN